MGKWLVRLDHEFLESALDATAKTDYTESDDTNDGVLSVMAVPTPTYSEIFAEAFDRSNAAGAPRLQACNSALRTRASALRGVFYDDDDMSLLMRLIDAGDDVAGLETLIADAECQVAKFRAQKP